jgi:heme/copper-type cytochrome/quinol oxidase subunit 2
MGRRRVAVAVAGVVAVIVATMTAIAAQDAAPSKRAFTVVAREGRFEPDRLDVSRYDLVTITLRSGDAAYSFAIDAYRLMKRVGAGDAVTFSFRADQAGSFVFYCSLSSDERCRAMRGTLVVADR